MLQLMGKKKNPVHLEGIFTSTLIVGGIFSSTLKRFFENINFTFEALKVIKYWLSLSMDS